jgi:hypothetical protein
LSRLDRILKNLQRRLVRLTNSRARADELLVASDIGIRDCELLYEATFLTGMAAFEDTLGEMLIEMVSGHKGSRAGNSCLITARSRDVLRTIMLGDDDYLKILPIDNIITLASRFLKPPIPFDIPDLGDRSRLSDALRIRNAIAHRSPFALDTFRKKVMGVGTLAANRRYPGPFLRQEFRTAPPQTRHELYLSSLFKISADIAARW